MSFASFFQSRELANVEPVVTAEPAIDPQLPTDISTLTDTAKWQHSKKRWDRTINPGSAKFRIVYDYFVEQLKTLSPDAVVRANFATHEVRKFLNGFVDKKRLGAIHAQQKREKRVFRNLRADGGVFKTADFPADLQNPAPLPLKLTILYFGLPVEPMTFTDPLQTDGTQLFANLNFASVFEDDEDEDFDDEDLSFVPEELRLLRFLNYYDRRGFGKDNSHSQCTCSLSYLINQMLTLTCTVNPEKTYELFYGIPMVVPANELMSRMGLRGAGVDDASDDEISDVDGTSDDASTSVDRVSPHITRNANSGEQVYLWGLSGRTTFSYFDAKSFFSAIDRLLGLSKRGDEYTSVGVTISLLSHPKGQRGPCTVLASDQCFLGRSAEDELNFYKTWLETVQYFDDQIKDGHALDMCVAQISQDVHFSESQKPLAYQPSLADDQVVSFSLSGEEDKTLSYLSMNDGVNGETASSHYQAWFKSLWRTLSQPTEEQLETYSVGAKNVIAPQSCLMNICTRNDDGKTEGEHWFFSDVGPTPDAWKSFIDAYQTNGHREFVLNAIPTTDPRASSITVPTETNSATTGSESVKLVQSEMDRQHYWGCHNHSEDTIAFMEARPGPVRLNKLGRPANGVQLDDFAKGKAFREWSYAHPLSIHMEGQHPHFPINAPPLEHILKTPGVNGKLSDSLPVMSTAVMTPSEQRHLQETVFEMRSLALNRAQPCPFKPCRSHFAIDDDGREKFQKHIQELHIDKKCPLCDNRTFGYLSLEQKKTHFFEAHPNHWSKKDDHLFNSIFKVKSKGFTHVREEIWNFCARCGRDHNRLNVVGDRAHHDNKCFPGLATAELYKNHCVQCGVADSTGHKCTPKTVKDHMGQPTTVVHCTKCALGTHLLSQSYAAKHHARCKGVHNDPAHFCCWCGVDVSIMPRTEGYKHLDGCRLKPSNGEGPIDTAAGAPRDSPRDNAQSRAVIRTMILTEDGKKKNIVEVPSECVFAGCKTQVGKYNAKALLKHFADTHGSGTDRLRTCPICDLDFSKREWTRKDDKVGHFRDHIERREKRLVLDLKIADKPNKLDAEVTELIRSRNLDEFSPAKKEVPVTHVSQDNSQMLAALNRVASDVKTGVNQTVNTFTTKLVCEMHGRDYILNQDIGTIKDRVDEVDMASKLNAEEMLDLMTNVKWCLDRLGDIGQSVSNEAHGAHKLLLSCH